jgi:spore germination protein KC
VSVRALNTTDEVEARVKVDVTAHLAETRSFVDITQDMHALIQMEEALADQIRGEILDAVQKAQSLRADIFGFGRMLMASDYRARKRICPKWDTVFTSLPVKVEVKARIDRSALETNRYEADTTK